MNRRKHITLLYFISLLQLGCAFNGVSQLPTGKMRINFIHTVNSRPFFLRDSIYINANNETYSITKLKYYLFNFKLNDQPIYSPQGKYILVNAEKNENTIEFENVPVGNYSSLSFELGIDSIDNCSGAQSGVLDPINDMFWTWNSGYVFFKMEGSSPNSTADLNRIEYHLGGYKNENSLITKINLSGHDYQDKQTFIIIHSEKETEVVTSLDLNNFWQGGKLSIREKSICVSPGLDAKNIGSCFSKLFSIKSISIP